MAQHTEAVAAAVEKFRAGTAVLGEALAGLTPEEAAFVPGPGKWNIGQIVRHVADSEFAIGMRLRQIIGEGGSEQKPTLIPFDQDAWAAEMVSRNADVAASFAVFRAMHDDSAALLASLPEEAFDRIGIHPERGTKTLLEWVEAFGGHAASHARQIHGIREMARHA